MNKNTLYFMTKLIALLGGVAINFSANMDIIAYVISILAFCCLFLLDFLVSILKKEKKLNTLLILTSILVALWLGEEYCVLVIISMIQLIDLLTDGNMFYQMSFVVTMLMMLILKPSSLYIILLVIIEALFVFARIAVLKLASYNERINELRRENVENKKAISDMSHYTKVLHEMTVMEERNRFSSRIHDELGHSISGSIILLEGARLHMLSNPEKAEQSILTVTQNLREGVDNIRKALREERPDKKELGLSGIKERLEHFKMTYQIETRLETEGDMNKISLGIWMCLQENLKEALTNTIKHARATAFYVTIAVHNKLIRVQFRDEGERGITSEDGIKKGLGLESIEERTLSSGGKCLFQKQHDGFSIVCIFML